MKRKLLVIAMGLSLSACSMLDALSLVSPSKPSVGVEAQIGEEANKQIILGDQQKRENEVDLDVEGNVTGDLNANTVSNEVDTSFSGSLETGSFTINNMPTKDIMFYAAFCIFLLGVFFPSHREIIKWYRDLKKELNNASNN